MLIELPFNDGERPLFDPHDKDSHVTPKDSIIRIRSSKGEYLYLEENEDGSFDIWTFTSPSFEIPDRNNIRVRP